MRSIKRNLLRAAAIIAMLAIALTLVVAGRQHLTYEAPYPAVHASTDSALIARGGYLVNGPAHCTGCHTDDAHEEAYLRGETVPLRGGHSFELPVGVVHSRNITGDTTHGIGALSDAEIARTLRYGVGSDGRAVLDFMPFYELSDADLAAIISYLRTVRPDATPVPQDEINAVGRIAKAFLIKPMGAQDHERPADVQPDTTAAYGAYLANSIANCRGCHTERDLTNGSFIGQPYAGWKGMQGDAPGVAFNTPNLTPDTRTGHLRDWDFDVFRMRFRAGPRFTGSPMPWASYARMSDDDLKAIWNYLRSLPAIDHETGPLLADDRN
ncbi:MAG: c-type cytochrome [Flavobacteriales bacterium]|nr:c-type cytochrome [Flavobacteriales bacterium]